MPDWSTLSSFLFHPPDSRARATGDSSYCRITEKKQFDALCFCFCFFMCVQPMGYGPRMQQPSSQSQFLPQAQFPAQGMNVTNMPLAPSGGQAPVSQVSVTSGFFFFSLFLCDF